MTKIFRSEFLHRHKNDRLDVEHARHDEAAARQLRDAGTSLERILAADVDGDGYIAGEQELGAVFAEINRLDNQDRTGLPTHVVASNDAGGLTSAGKALNAFGVMIERGQVPISQLVLRGPVGPGNRNRADDVEAVQRRLRDLGFEIDVDGQFGSNTKRTLQVCEAMLTGEQHIANCSGKISPNSVLHQVLASKAAPRWVRLDVSGPGFVSVDVDGFGYGSERLNDVIREAGGRFYENYLQRNPNKHRFQINDATVRQGGPTRDHDSHQAGLDLDIRLPSLSGTEGSQVGWSSYDREATWNIFKSLAVDPRVDGVILTDPVLVRRANAEGGLLAGKMRTGGTVHNNHMHVDVLGYHEDVA